MRRPKQRTNQTWTFWSHPWRPSEAGSYAIALTIDDRPIPTKRLDTGFYKRMVRHHRDLSVEFVHGGEI